MSFDTAFVRDKLSYQAISLGVVALVASAALSVGNKLTGPAIAEAEARDLQSSLSQVLPEGSYDNELLKDTLDVKVSRGDTPATVLVYRARKAGAVTGAVFRMARRGYAGDIVVLMGVDAKGTLLGVRVIKHQETPGLGDKIDIAKTSWILDFNGKSLDNLPADKWAVKKDGGVFDQFAGATITPRAVVSAVKGGLDFFAAHRDEIIGD
ncbi:MAG: electron transport complex subunit RsxG [Gammaproteobacteria bacterium]|nr:electron transport complex subunit RsxG [Gammaproteobacteria bacterium]MBU1414060.1 electron transport complex subunit RsxG [Gammaproteobacteria bacterium]